MADAVTTQVLVDGARNIVMKFTNVSDGTGESAVKKVDVTNTSNFPINPTTHLKVMKILYDVRGGFVQLLWDASSPVLFETLSGFGKLNFRRFGGLTNNGGAGVTGSILFTTTGFMANSAYTITLEMIKGI